MVAGDSSDNADMASCIGGQFLSEDIGACLEHGVRDARCFNPVSSVARAIENPANALMGATEVAELQALRSQIDALAVDPLGTSGLSETISDLQNNLEEIKDELALEKLDPADKISTIADEAASALGGAAENVKNRLGGLFKNK